MQESKACGVHRETGSLILTLTPKPSVKTIKDKR